MKRLELLLEDLTRAVEEEYDKLLLLDDKEAKKFVEYVLRDLNEEDTPLEIWTSFIMTISCAYDGSDSLKQKMIKVITEKMDILMEKYNL